MKTKTKIFSLCIMLSGLLGAVSADSRFVFEPAAWGRLGGFSRLENLFDAQPDIANLSSAGTDFLIPAASGGGLGGNSDTYTDRTGVLWVDFGVNYNQVQIVELWTAFRATSTYDGTKPFVDLWWADSNTLTTENIGGVTTVTKDPSTTTNITDPSFNFGLNAIPFDGNNIIWRRDSVFATPVVPERRYLMIGASMASNTDIEFGNGRATELAIIAIPEPGTLVLVGLALGAVFLGRRRARR